MAVYESFSEDITFEIGKKLGEKADKGDIICLEGDLGVGKTVFTKGFAAGLNIEENIDSPTFTIVQEYTEGRLPLYHFDVYRIGDISEMDEIGYEDYFFGEGVCLIEWASKIEELIPESAIHITIEKDLLRGFEYRRVVVEK
nr:tRNA (adenosine(37)-N6)-threonylcarbamoyltransferase complex ATPase subunit type 1 TsaE [uncultured Catonella sp.]